MTQRSRRNFLATAAALAGTALIAPSPASGGEPEAAWDLAWLDALRGKHRQVFDMEALDGLTTVRNWLNAHEEVYGLRHPDLNAVVGIGRSAFPMNASDELYRKFPIGEEWKVTDPETQLLALRNIYLDGGNTPKEQQKTIRALQARGVIFWQCNNALRRISERMAELVKRPHPDVYQELKSGLHPWVILVPAHTMLIGLAQEHGCAYEKL
jgi:hypothetical protein